MAPSTAAQATLPLKRERLSLDLSAQVSSLLDHASDVLGVPKSQLAVQAILELLPSILERADAVQKRAQAHQAQVKGKR